MAGTLNAPQKAREVVAMHSIQRLVSACALSSITLVLTGTAANGASTQVPPGVTVPPGVPADSAPNVADGIMGLLVAAALIVVLGAMILLAKVYDLSQKREEQSLALEARISDAMLADPLRSRLPVAATVRVPL